MCQILGYSRDELMGIDNRQYMSEQNAGRALEIFNRVYRTGQSHRIYDWEVIKKDGSLCYCEAWVALIRDPDGQPVGFRGIARDVTGRKKLEAQLRHAQQMEAIGTLAGGIAHDFNNILFSVIGYTELSLEEVPKETRLHQNLSQVMESGYRAKDLVKQILTISRQDEQELKPISIIPLGKEALKMLRSTLPTSIEFRENICSSQLVVFADPTQLHQVILNLATNAKHAMPNESGVLEVTVKPVSFDESVGKKYPDLEPGNYARIVVSDTGTGIPEQYVDRIFEPYFTTREKGEGTGLGLSIVHGIVKGLKGHIAVYSKPGKGSAFHVYLPLTQESRAVLPDRKDKNLPTGNESILLVDDEQPLVKMQQQILEGLGYRVTPAVSSLDALETFRSAPDQFDILITDMTIPDMTGENLAKAIKEIRPDVPVILCTGFSRQIDIHREDIKIEALLTKPVDKTKMAKVIRRLLDEAKLKK